jgi:hypothetical protein
MSTLLIRTSESLWLARMADAYKQRVAFTLLDDAATGIDPRGQTLLEMATHARLSKREIVGASTAAGVGVVGIAMIVAAFIDPEPTSKLLLVILSGATLVLSGGFAAYSVITKQKPPNVSVHVGGFDVTWQ